MARSDLTDRQKQVLDFIISHTRDKGFPPSVREICDALGLKSPSSAHSHLIALEKKGYVLRNASSTARAITVNESKVAELPDYVGEELPADDPMDEVYSSMVALPLVGRVAAGVPIFAEQNVEEMIGLPTQIVGDSSSFLLKVRGESMIDAGILDGDIVAVREQPTADNGDIVVALIDDEATVKTFFKEPDRIRLQPENPTMEPIYTTEVIILGKVTALFRTIR